MQNRSKILEENQLLRESYMKTLKNLKKAYDDGTIILNKNVLERVQLYLEVPKLMAAAGIKKESSFPNDEH